MAEPEPNTPSPAKRTPSFTGAFITLIAGIVFIAAGLGLAVIVTPPSYYPIAVWRTIGLVYLTLGAITIGFAYRGFRRFFNSLPPDTPSQELPSKYWRRTDSE